MIFPAPASSARQREESDPLTLSLSELVGARMRWQNDRKNAIGWGLEHGSRRSRLRGVGSEFDTIGPYQDGDDPRHIDWHATARTGQAQVRRYFHESHRPVAIAVDLRTSMHFGTRDQLLSKTAAIAASALSWDFANEYRPLTLFCIDDRPVRRLISRTGRRHRLRMVNELHLDYGRSITGFVDTSGPVAPLDRLMEQWSPMLTRRADLIVISDFSDRGDQLRGVCSAMPNIGIHAVCIEDRLTTEAFSGRFPLGRRNQSPDESLSVGRRKPAGFLIRVERWRRELEDELLGAGFRSVGFCHSADVGRATLR